MQFMKGVFRRRRRNFWGSKGGHAIYEVGFRAGGAKNRLNLGSELKSSMTPPLFRKIGLEGGVIEFDIG